ncbi:MAG: RDD family protein [Pseudomonadota bacterium]
MEKSATPSLPAAGLWRRISAIIYESLLLLALLFIADYLFLALTHNTSSPLFKTLLQVYLLLMMASYFSWSWLRGQTLAMKTWRIRIVNQEGAPITLKQALLRFALAFLLIPAFGISLIWALFDRDKQFLHDRLANTRLVRTDV